MNKNNFLFAGLITASIFSSSVLKAQCTAVSEFSENFDTLSCCAMGVVPSCWDSILTAGGGNQIISSTSPASSPSNVYQTGYTKISIVVMPPLTNINAGTHHFRFKARVNSGPGLLEFGYITNVADASTFVVLQSITINNSTYDSTSERIFDVPTTVPANARLAIRNPGTTWAGHYWDDAVWEPKSALSTNDLKLNDFKIYPNPFTDIITISETDDIQNLKITDVSGRLIKTIEKASSKINLNDLKPGIYFITFKQKDGKSQTIKAIKE
ncbi:T9SS type A sorting domain-containing protein [Chryseobacterium terrae]|uniref:T9SS type A sorting domain-containing protein n=1 Tax=Chryseobacterium terrae TaxID=3163299 RepID=A0ABW8Y093_9FLAO